MSTRPDHQTAIAVTSQPAHRLVWVGHFNADPIPHDDEPFNWEIKAPVGTVAQIVQLVGDIATPAVVADGMMLQCYFSVACDLPEHPSATMLAHARLLLNTGQFGDVHLGWGRMINSTAAVLALMDADDPLSPVLSAAEFSARLDRVRLTEYLGLSVGVTNETGQELAAKAVRFAALLWVQEVA